MIKKQIALIVLDGWGYREDRKDNAILSAKTPIFNDLWSKCPHTTLLASGLAVGLPEGQMGNSEVGHMTIGAGKTLDQDLVRIDKSILSGEFADNLSLVELFNHVKKNNGTLHAIGLLSDGGVHSHINHLFAFLDSAKDFGISKIAVHVFTDGRDVPPQSASLYIKKLEDKLKELGVGFIASISGRFYAMDRDKNWDRLEKAENAFFKGEGIECNIEPHLFIENLYKEGKVDEHLVPIVCNKDGYIKKGDGVFFFNFRADRARMMTSKIIEKIQTLDLSFVTMTDYGEEYKTEIAFYPIVIETTLTKELSKNGLTQVHIAETEKFAHATYFLNGGIEGCSVGEEHILVPSRKDILTYDLAPRMSAEGIADKAIEQIKKGVDFIFINFANPDMVGHTANVPAVIEAIEETDKELGRVISAISENDGVAFITADHGNAEINIDQITGNKHTSHTTDPVPLIVTNIEGKLRDGGTLADITPTILEILDIKKPESMTGKNLIEIIS